MEKLRQRENWLNRRDKQPINPHAPNTAAKVNDPATWASYEKVYQNYVNYGLGIGFVIPPEYFVIDLDHIDEQSEIAGKCLSLLGGTYAETSPSGKGLHIIGIYNPALVDPAKYKQKNSAAGIEIYAGGNTNRYMTYTGAKLPNAPGTIADCTEQLKYLYSKYMEPTTTADNGNAHAADTSARTSGAGLLELMELMNIMFSERGTGQKWRKIYETGTAEYHNNDESSRDCALCEKLAFYTGSNAAEIDHLFRRSACYRDKWDEKRGAQTYGELTIGNAILNNAGKQYRPKAAPQTLPQVQMQVESAADLMQSDLAPVRFFVSDLIPQGLTILASPPKFGKSWLSLDLCISVSAGRYFLGKETHKADVLYLALEDSRNRLQDRIRKVFPDVPQGFRYTITAPTINGGLIEQLRAHMRQFPDTGVIIVDTLQKVRDGAKGSEGAYQTDYREIGALKSIADEFGIAVILVHHLKKGADPTDTFARISGTMAISGAADTMIVLSRESRSDKKTRLSATGRDIEPVEWMIAFNNYRWECLGEVEQIAEREKLDEYQTSPYVRTIRGLVNSGCGKWQGTASEFAAAAGLADDSRVIGWALRNLAPMLMQTDGIKHTPPASTSRKGRVHTFEKIQ